MTNRSGSSRRVPIRVAVAAVLGLLAALLLPVPPAAVAAPAEACDRRTNNTYQKLLECEGVREHQAQFQKIADSNDDPFSGHPRRRHQATPTASSTSPASWRTRVTR